MNYIPLLNRVILKLNDKKETTTPGGLIISGTTADDLYVEAIVMATGPGFYDHGTFSEITVFEGDTVLIPRGFGAPIKIEGGSYIMVRDTEIVGIVG